jgi:hypothetical protein
VANGGFDTRFNEKPSLPNHLDLVEAAQDGTRADSAA